MDTPPGGEVKNLSLETNFILQQNGLHILGRTRGRVGL
jgi:hypothetical protein